MRLDSGGSCLVWPLHRVGCHLIGLHGQADETFPAVADILATGCLLAIFSKRLPRIGVGFAALMPFPVLLVPAYLGALRFHLTPALLFLLWPLMHCSIEGLLLHVVQRPYRIVNIGPVVWLGKISYSLYLWQQLFVFGEHPKPWYSVLFAVAAACGSYHWWNSRFFGCANEGRNRANLPRPLQPLHQFRSASESPSWISRRIRRDSRPGASSVDSSRLRELEGNAAFVVLPARSLKIKIRDGNLALVTRCKVEQRGSLNGIVPDFHGAAIFEHQKCGRQGRIGIHSRSLWLGFRGGVCRSLFHRRHVRMVARASTIVNGRASLIVGVILSSIGLILRRSVLHGIWHRNGVPDGTNEVRTIAPVTIAVALTVVPVMVAMMDAVTSDKGRTRRRRVALRSERSDTGRWTVDGTASEARRGHGRRRTVDLGRSRCREK